MLKVQEYLQTHSIEDLKIEFGIEARYHPEYPLVILNYSQIDSPKMNPIVQECRGIVIDTTDNSIACGCMSRFFNLGEATEITDQFDWSNKINALSKEDGSLLSLFWNKYSKSWQVKTRGSWADFPIGENMPRWDELFLSLLNKKLFTDYAYPFFKNYTYVFEMCSMYNQVVRQYPDPKLFLLTVIHTETNEELKSSFIDSIAKQKRLARPAKIKITNVEAVKKYIKELEETDGTAEGLVLQDKNGLRIKCKSGTYLAYARLGGNGNITITRNIVPLILANEQDEAISIFPHIKERVIEIQEYINSLVSYLEYVWVNVHEIENQKEFALAVKSYNTPLDSILFRMKKEGTIFDGNLCEEVRKHPELLIKIIGS